MPRLSFQWIKSWFSERRRITPPSEQAHHDLILTAEKCRDAGDWASAAHAYWLALDRFPFTPALWVQYGHVTKALNDLAGAEAAYRRALALAPEDWDAYIQLGHSLKLQGRYSEARQAYAMADQLNPDNPETLRELSATDLEYAIAAGNHARDARDWAAATNFFREVVDQDPRRDDQWIELGHTQKELGDTAAAQRSYEHALRGGPHDSIAWAAIGHLSKQYGRYEEAANAFARSVICEGLRSHSWKELNHLAGCNSLEADSIIHWNFRRVHQSGGFVCDEVRNRMREHFFRVTYSSVDPTGARRRHAHLTRRVAASASVGKLDIIYLPNIDWGYRTQRAQQLAAALGARGHRIFYISPTIERMTNERRYHRLIAEPAKGVFEVRLHSSNASLRPLDVTAHPSSNPLLDDAIGELCHDYAVGEPFVIVQHPGWASLMSNSHFLVYDCLDDYSAFPNAPDGIDRLHLRMVGESTFVTTTSVLMKAEIEQKNTVALIKNGVSEEFILTSGSLPPAQPVIGYCGVIADWFEAGWIEYCARAHPDWRFVLIGEVITGCVSNLRQLSNVEFHGEQPHSALPAILDSFSVSIIPFRLSRLTEVTDPVKLYEYMARGIPVVSNALPEVIASGAPGLAVATSATSFEAAIEQALATDSSALRLERIRWALSQTWTARAEDMEATFQAYRSKTQLTPNHSMQSETLGQAP